MKINKKLITLMMTIVIGGAALTGCGQKTVTDNNSTQTETPSVEPSQTPVDTNGETTGEQVEESYGDVDPTVAKETFFVITDGIEMPANMDMTSEMFADTYGIDPSILDSYVVTMPMMNVHADEVAVFEVKDAANIDQVKAGIEKRQKALEAQWSSYLPEQLELVQNYKVAVKGNLVLFVISPNADQIVAKFEA